MMTCFILFILIYWVILSLSPFQSFSVQLEGGFILYITNPFFDLFLTDSLSETHVFKVMREGSLWSLAPDFPSS